MSKARCQCQATTKAGAQCKNTAVSDSVYCHVHTDLAKPAPSTVTSTIPSSTQIDEIVAQLRAEAPEYEPPAYSPQAMLALLEVNASKAVSILQAPLLNELKQNLAGTKPQDMLDPEAWKGLWYVLNYTTQIQSLQALETVESLLGKVPGGRTLLDLKSGLEGASPKDLLDINTWKGALLIADATVKAQVAELTRKVLGDQE